MASTYTPIATTTLGSAAQTITFSSISGAYTDLVLVLSAYGQTGQDAYLRFNGDTGSNYSDTILRGNGSTASSVRDTSSAGIDMGVISTTSGVFTPIIFNIQNYSNSTTYKTALGRISNANSMVTALVGLWRNTAAITQIDLFERTSTGWQIGTTATLYGIAAA
jgi:hypothetical protein